MGTVIIKDRPCGSGKTSQLLNSFETTKMYLVVVPLLSEVTRVLTDACVDFYEPVVSENYETKLGHALSLIDAGLNVVITHELYKSFSRLKNLSMLDEYHVIIDEVPDTMECIPINKKSFETFYIGTGQVQVDEFNRVKTTSKWEEDKKNYQDTLDKRIYAAASNGTLTYTKEGGLMKVLPGRLFKAGKTLTVLTFLSDGSYFPYYLKKMGIRYVVDSLPASTEGFKEQMMNLLDPVQIPGYKSGHFGHAKQSNGLTKEDYCNQISTSLKNLASRFFKGVDRNFIILTCIKDGWGDEKKPGPFQKGSKLKRVNWIPNTTRGTNDYAHCSHAIYLYNQNINPAIGRFLNLPSSFKDDYAITELIQWVYRTRIRKGEPITLFIGDPRMMKLLNNWMGTETRKAA
jgi:hypothetical protein